ncbi:hypothetical protein FACS189494_06120 [Spirochaetia bacterium]|nr:hypothetical protein FACS189494_06120 [Spirochaetia bacterium]
MRKMEKMKNGLAFFSLLLVSAVFFSCATTVEVRSKNEARIKADGIKKIAVIPLESAYIPKAKLSFKSIATGFVKFFTKTKDERIYEAKRTMATYLTRVMEAAVQDDLVYKLVDYSKLEDKEKKDYAELTDAYIEGVIDDFNYFDDRSHINVGGSASLGSLIITRKVTIKWTYNVINASTNEIIFSTTRSGEKKVTFDYEDGVEYEPEKIGISIINSQINDLRHDFYPWTATEKRPLKKDSLNDPKMKAAEELVKNKSFAKAFEAYNSVYEKTQNEAALYNAALLKEYLDNRDN